MANRFPIRLVVSVVIFATIRIALAQPGSLDHGFAPYSPTYRQVEDFDVQGDGRVLICGNFTNYGGMPRVRVARLHSDGSIDESFDPGIGPNGSVQIIRRSPGDKVVIAGGFTSVAGVTRHRIALLNSDGTLDTTFNYPEDRPSQDFHTLAIQSDGRVVAYGTFKGPLNHSKPFCVRLQSDGSPDPTFMPMATQLPLSYASLVEANGKIVFAGLDFFSTNQLVRLQANGSFDPLSVPRFSDRIIELASHGDGRLTIVGSFKTAVTPPSTNATSRNGIARLAADGRLDPMFNPGSGFSADARTVAVRRDGRLIVGGSFTNYNGAAARGLASLHANGAFDDLFSVQFSREAAYVDRLLVQPDGKLLIAGVFYSVDGFTRWGFARLHMDDLVPGPPQVTVQPTNRAVVQGQSASFFTGAASYVRPTFQWRRDGTNLPAATNGLLVLTNVGVAQRGDYDVVISNPLGAVTSVVARLGVFFAPIFVTQPTNLTVDAGQNAVFMALADGNPLPELQWQFNGTNFLSETNAELRLAAVTPSAAGRYAVMASNSIGSVVSTSATLTVRFAPFITSHPTSVVVNAGQTAVFSVIAQGVPSPAYQWQFNGTNLPNRLSPSLILGNVSADQAGSYRVVVSNELGVTVSAEATLTVNTFPPSIVVQPMTQTIAVGRTVTFSVGVTAAPPASLQWKFNDVDLQVPSRSTLSLTNIQFTNAGSYSVVVSNSEGVVTSDAAVLTVIPAPTGPGDVDVDFYPGSGADGAIHTIAVQPDGKLLLGGEFFRVSNVPRNRVARLNVDGSLDHTFVPTNIFGERVSAILPQSDGKVLFGGAVNRFGSTPLFGRLNPDGSADSAFMGANGLFQPVNGLAVQSDGQILAALTVPEDFAGPLVARFDPNGARDWSLDAPVLNNFPAGGAISPIPCHSVAVDDGEKLLLAWQSGFWRLLPAGGSDLTFARPRAMLPWNFSPKSVAVQADGRIIIGGLFTNLNGVPLSGLARLYADGSVDASFVPNLQPKNVNALQIQPDGKIIIGGGFTNVNGIARRRLARLNSDGSLDTTFPDPDVRPGEVLAMTLTADCKLIIAGTFRDIGDVPRRGIARLHLDPMSAPAIITPPTSQTVTQGQTASFYVETSCVPPGGYQWQFDGANLLGQTNSRLILREASFTNAGSYTVVVSNAFGVAASAPAELIVMAAPGDPGALAGETVTGFGTDGAVTAITQQADGKTLIGGRFTHVHGVPRNQIARLNSDGTLDASFNIGVGVTRGADPASVNALAVQSDGSIVVAGWFTSVNGLGRTNIARLLPDGGVDGSFLASRTDRPVFALLVQGDGRIVIAGEFSYIGTDYRPTVGRLNTNGSLEPTFNQSGNRLIFTAYSLAQKRNGQIVVAGHRPLSQEALGIISSNGIWASFSAVQANRPIYAVSVSPNDTLLVAGAFTNFGGVARSRVARLDGNGIVLSNAWQNVNIAGDVRALLRLDCGKVVIAGAFTNVNGRPRFGIARLNEDGSLDDTYAPGSGTDGAVLALAQQQDGKVICGGGFSQVNRTLRGCLARLNADSFTSPTLYSASTTVAGGSTVTLRVEAGCWPPDSIFRWYLNGTNIALTSVPSLTISNFRFVNAGQYSVTLSNILGVATSPAVDLGVNQLVHAGAIDLDFLPASLTTNVGSRLAQYGDGRILLALVTNSFSPWSRIVRLHANGALDSTFTPINLQGEVRSIAPYSNNVIYVGGAIPGLLTRWYNEGTRFDQPLGFPSGPTVNAILTDSLGGILLAGQFAIYSSGTRSNLVRLQPSGILDTNFFTGLSGSSPVTVMVGQADGRILVGGAFLSFAGNSRKLLARVYNNGALDPSFSIPSSVSVTGSVSALALQHDGKILVGGPFRFESADGVRYRLARLHSDGNLDLSFDPGFQLVDSVAALAAEPDGRILVAGLFSCGSNCIRRVVRLNQDGLVDSSFDCSPGPDGPVTAMLRQPDGRVLISGDFKHVNGVPRQSVARLLGDLRIIDVTSSAAGWGCSVATIAGKSYRLESNDSLHDLSWTVRATASGNGEVVTLMDPTPSPVPRFYRIRME